MQIRTYKTSRISAGENLLELIDDFLPAIEEKTVVVVTSKIISLCQNDVVKKNSISKEELIKKEADYYLDDRKYPPPFGYHLTIKNNIFTASAGIDESNGEGIYILWPRHIQETTNQIWDHLRLSRGLKKVGVLVTDSNVAPLKRGTRGIGLSWCGFLPYKNYIGKPDIFGQKLRVTYANYLDGLAASAVVVMGEGDEQTPLAGISDVPFIDFQDRHPTSDEMRELMIQSLDEDVYAPLLTSVEWEKRGKNK